ncbi:MAG: TolC family protein [Cyanobacteria bacterium M_surface_10_m2_119]|nr:TolC family protein [Cyanobacteria bacterium M_surface_10_m2_119]
MSNPATQLALLSALGLPLLGGAVVAKDAVPVEQSAQAAPSSAAAPAAAASPAPAPAAPAAAAETPLPLLPLPLAPEVKGQRPRVNPKLVTPAATELAPAVNDLPAPDSLALPTRPDQVMIKELRPLSLAQVENLAEVNNPNLKAIASQVDQAQSNLRAQISQWYPNLNLEANSLPIYNDGQTRNRLRDGSTVLLNADRWAAAASITAQWSLINPQRNPTIAAARDQFERAKYQYVIALRDLRLQAAQAYFDLQQADDQVRIGQESVRASLVSLRDSRARFQAGVATKLEVLEAETQLARDQQLLTTALASQSVARRALASLLDLPQTVTPTAQDPSRVLGVWQPSLQESIVAAYAFREELDQVLLDISIANSQANAALAEVQPFLNIFAGFEGGWFDGNQPVVGNRDVVSGGNYDTTVGLNLSWRLFDGGAAAAQARQNRQLAQENSFRFAQRRDAIRLEVEDSFYELEKNNRNITTTSREVISARESLRLARLRFQAGVTTQREVVDNQRDLTNAEVRFSNAITDYNKRLAELRRRTGLDQIVTCPAQTLPAVKPVGASDVPVEPSRLLPACQAANPGPV